MPSRTLKGALIILLVGATASFLDKFASREEFTVGELRKIRHEREYLCPVPLTVRGTQALVSFAPLAFKLFYAARQNAVLRRSPFPSP